MDLWLIFYMTLYVTWSFAGIWVDVKEQVDWLIVGGQIVAAVIAFSGMLAYGMQLDSPLIQTVWKGLFWVMVIGEGISFQHDIKELIMDENIKWMAVPIMLVALILLIPSLWINLMVGYADLLPI